MQSRLIVTPEIGTMASDHLENQTVRFLDGAGTKTIWVCWLKKNKIKSEQWLKITDF
jgi:hypothetical protein